MEIQNRAGESRILLVEDDKEIREGIEIFLRGQDRKSTRQNSSHIRRSRMPSSA